MEKPKGNRLKLLVGTAFIAVLLLGFFIGTIYSIYPANVTEVWFQPPIHDATYIAGVYNSTHYYMKNGTTGNYDCLTTNASAVFNNAVGNMTTGGKLFVKAGTYNITNTIFVSSDVSIEGEQIGLNTYCGVYLNLSYGANCDMFNIINASSHDYFVQISHMCLDGAYASQTAMSNGINITGQTSDIRIHDLYIMFFHNDSILINRAGSLASYYVFIYNNWLEQNVGCGINVTGVSGYAMAKVFIYSNILTQNLYGFWGNYATQITIGPNNYIGSNLKNGIDFSASCSQCEIINNQFYRNSQAATNTYDDIYINGGTMNQIQDNVFWGVSGGTNCRYQLYLYYVLSANVQNNAFFTGGASGTVYVQRTTNIPMVRNNIGFYTENTFYSLVNTTATSFAFNHGLNGTANSVQCSFNLTVAYTWTWTSNATAVTITVTPDLGATLPANYGLLSADVKYIP